MNTQQPSHPPEKKRPTDTTLPPQSTVQPTPAPRVKKIKKLTGIRGWFHSLFHKNGVVKF